MLGILSVTGFLSLWISNAAVASMILPIVISIVRQLVIIDRTNKRVAKKINAISGKFQNKF